VLLAFEITSKSFKLLAKVKAAKILISAQFYIYKYVLEVPS
jgi:hypothetical protein